MNPYESGGYTQQAQQRHGHQQQQQHQQYQQQHQQSQGGYYAPPAQQQYTPQSYAQPAHRQARSPPPLQHPVPTHPPVQMRDPAPTPSPRMPYAQAQSQQHQQQHYQSQQARSQPQQQPRQSYEQRSSFDHSSAPTHTYDPPPQQHRQPQQHQQHPQQQQGVNGLPIPSFFNEPTTQMGMQFGRSAVMAGQEYVEQNLNRWVNRAALQPYFNVSTSYVVSKLKLLIFPWRHKLWTRIVKRSDTGETTGYLSPRDDINAPDMYIPVMAFVTYVLLVGVSAGTSSGFSPEILGPTASSAMAVIFLEFTMIKLCTYLLNISNDVPILDLLAYSGYKFVGIIVSLLVQLVGAPKSVFWGVFLYTGAATGLFLLRSLRYVILPEASTGTVLAPQRKRRIHFLICLSVLQFGFMWILL